MLNYNIDIFSIELGSDLTRQIRQASVMLKSAVMFSQEQKISYF